MPNDRSQETQSTVFDPFAFLATTGPGRTAVHVKPKGIFFSQGDQADATFYLQRGRARLDAVSESGKEATILLLTQGDFVGEECLTVIPGLRTATASAITSCTLLKIDKPEMVRVLHEQPAMSEMFLKFLLTRLVASQAHVVDLFFDSSEKRLARILLVMAEFGREDEKGILIPKITQDTLASMVGTTRSRTSHFMKHFRDLGYITYDGRIRVQMTLLSAIRSGQAVARPGR